jgi:Flp pilus assembly protein TadD
MSVDEARASYESGDYRRAWQLASGALAERPDDPELLRIARDVARELDDADAWRDLGDSLAEAGQVEEAGDAFRRVAELRPHDTTILVDLGYVALAAGRPTDAASSLEQALERDPSNIAALRGVIEVRRRAGQFEGALGAARTLVEARPDDVLAAIDLADLALELGNLVEAEATFRRLLSFDDDPQHEVPYSLHGLIEVEIRRERWRRALDLAVDATRVDRLGRTTEVLAYVVAQVFGESDRPAPERREIDEALALSRAEHRRLHAEEAALV